MKNGIDIGSAHTLLAHGDLRAREALASKLEPVNLPVGSVLVAFGEETREAYFLQAGVASVIARSPKKKTSEIGIIGREGIIPALPALSRQPSLFDVIMKIEGRGYQISVQSLHEMVETLPSLRQLLDRFVEAFLVQSAYNAFAAVSHSPEERVARCLLMCHDRMDGDEIPLTKKSLSAMALADYDDVAEVLPRLEAQRLVRSTRNRVVVNNRAGLEVVARDCYGRAEYAYRHLIGEFR